MATSLFTTHNTTKEKSRIFLVPQIVKGLTATLAYSCSLMVIIAFWKQTTQATQLCIHAHKHGCSGKLNMLTF